MLYRPNVCICGSTTIAMVLRSAKSEISFSCRINQQTCGFLNLGLVGSGRVSYVAIRIIGVRKIIDELRLAFTNATRLACLREALQPLTPVSSVTLSVLVVISLLLYALLDALHAGQNLAISEHGVSTFIAVWTVFAGLVALICANRTLMPLSRILADLTAISCLFVCIYAIAKVLVDLASMLGVVGSYGEEEILAYAFLPLVIFLWNLTTLWRAGRRFLHKSIRFSGLRLVIAACLPVFLLPQSPLVHGSETSWERLDIWAYGPSFWQRDREQASTPSLPRIDVERTYYRQNELVSRALQTVRPSNGGQSQMFFVGAAPYATQDVFKREVLSARSLFDRRFKTKDRSIVLINHRDTIKTTPLASVSNLEFVLQEIGHRMKADRDVLVLFITTHGTHNRLSVHFPSLSLNDLTAPHLARLLDKSGIKNRVLIISACHSGSFIPHLAGENTMILAASHADTQSFGCSNSREWTYFGDALLNHAMRESRSFVTAFNRAKRLISTWEAREGLAPSKPQISAGPAILNLLNKIERQFEDGASLQR